MREDYTFTGNIGMVSESSWESLIRIVCWGGDPRTASMLEVADPVLKKYVTEVSASTTAEGYAQKVFHFDKWCRVWQVDVLDESGNAVKIVDGTKPWRPFIGEDVMQNGPFWIGGCDHDQ